MLNKKLWMVAFAALAFTGCGKNDFNGTYTGYETQSAGSVGGTVGNYGGYATPVTLQLKQEDDFVTGSYSAQSSYSGGQSMTGQFTASAKDADKLTNVQLVLSYSSGAGGYPNQGYGSYPNYNTGGSFYSGELSSQNDGRSLSGTLNMMGGYSGQGGKTLMLNRSGD